MATSHVSLLDTAISDLRESLGRFNPDEDIICLEQASSATEAERLVGLLGLPAVVLQSFTQLYKRLEGLVDCLIRVTDQETSINCHLWGSVYLLCRVSRLLLVRPSVLTSPVDHISDLFCCRCASFQLPAIIQYVRHGTPSSKQ